MVESVLSLDMAKFCPNCGTPLATQDIKFCPECGTNLQAVLANLAATSTPTIFPDLSDERTRDTEEEHFRLNVYDLGVKLEETVASIFESMGYCVERRKRLPTKSGATAEIDVLLRRGNRVKAVECKNYDPSRAVGVSDLRVFKSKLEETGIFCGVFITNTYLSEDAEKLADSIGIEVWDGDTLREKFFTYKIGRTRNPSLIQDPVLPVITDFATASNLSLRNSAFVKLYSARLLYHPYIIIKYRLLARRSDPTGKSHLIEDEGSCIVDALDGDIINRKKSIIEGIGKLLKSQEERRQSKEERYVTEDLNRIEPVIRPVLATHEYDVSVAEPEISEAEAIKIVRFYVIKKNTRTINYQQKIRGEYETRQLKIVPRQNEVSIRGTKLVYVPKWDLQYEAGQYSFSREILASSGRTLVDDLAKCSKCVLLKEPCAVVCEECGRPLCDKHSYQEIGRWLCEDHISDTLRQQVKGAGIFSRFKIRRS
jgi:predicted RecB family endonuclease